MVEVLFCLIMWNRGYPSPLITQIPYLNCIFTTKISGSLFRLAPHTLYTNHSQTPLLFNYWAINQHIIYCGRKTNKLHLGKMVMLPNWASFIGWWQNFMNLISCQAIFKWPEMFANHLEPGQTKAVQVNKSL